MDEIITLTGYFKEYFHSDTITKGELSKSSWLFIYNRDKNNKIEDHYPNISLDILQYMPNLKEAMLQLFSFTDWHYISALSSLNSLCIAFKEIDSEMASYIIKLPKLRRLHLTRLNVSDYDTLSRSKTLTQLLLHKIEGINDMHIEKFTNITQLSIDEIECDLTCGIKKLSKLKKLDYEDTPVKSLDFLRNLKNLESFKLSSKTDDSALSGILPSLKKIKEFEYPLADLSLVKECPKLTRIYIDGKNCKNIPALQNSSINSVMIMDAENEEEAKRIIDEVKQYCRLGSYGYNAPWKNK